MVLAEARRIKLRHEAEQHAHEIRERCKTLRGFVREAWKVLEPATEYLHNWHIDAICLHLEAITFGTMRPRLIINIPPGSSKSLIVSVMWQAWMWGPCGMRSKRFLSTSFEERNVTRDTRKTRDLIMSEWFQTLWPEVRLSRTAETSFANTDMGSREGTTFRGIMGKRGDFFTIDDPHSLDGAESETERDKATRRFVEGGQSRVNDVQTSAIVIIMQRVHMTDLTGVVLAKKLGYEHLMIPMEFELARSHETAIGWSDPRTHEGQLMDPRRMPVSEINNLKNEEYSWAGQYQQRPAPREGGMFKVENIEFVTHAPEGSKPVRGWDIAGSTRRKSPYTVGLKLREGRDGFLYVMDVKRLRAKIDKAEALIIGTAHEEKLAVRHSIPQDPGSAGLSQRDKLSKELAGLDFRFSTETGEKQDRAIPLASQVNAGKVRFVIADWNAALIDEMRNFPNGEFKDQVDAFSRAYAEILSRPKVDNAVGVPRIAGMARG